MHFPLDGSARSENGLAESPTRFHFGPSAERQRVAPGGVSLWPHRKLREFEMSKVFPTQSRFGRARRQVGRKTREALSLSFSPRAFVHRLYPSALTLIDSSWRRRRMLVILFFLEGETYPLRQPRFADARYRPTSVCETVGVPPTI